MTKKLLLVLVTSLIAPLLNAGEVKNSDDILTGVKQMSQEDMISVKGDYYLFQIVYPESGRKTESENWGNERDYGYLIVNGDTGMEISADIYQVHSDRIVHSWWDDGTGWNFENLPRE